MGAPLERLFPGRHKTQLVQAQLFQQGLGNNEMSVVNRIEGAAEESYP
jgi:hypothetical protein